MGKKIIWKQERLGSEAVWNYRQNILPTIESVIERRGENRKIKWKGKGGGLILEHILQILTESKKRQNKGTDKRRMLYIIDRQKDTIIE